VFTGLDNYLWQLTYKWAKHSHPNKSKHWIVCRYFGQFNPSRQDRWVFGDRDSGFYLRKFAWTKIIRHQMVKGTSSVDPALTEYWAQRRRKGPPPPMDTATLRLLRAQHGRCPLCGNFLLHAEHEPQSPHEWEQWLRATRKATAKQHIVVHEGPGMPDERATPSPTRPLPTTTDRRRRPWPSTTSAGPRPIRACLSRMRGQPASPVCAVRRFVVSPTQSG
jgi:RNA-directed DNA polymerase